MNLQNNFLKRIKKIVQNETGITTFRGSDKSTVLSKMCIAYLASEVFAISKVKIAEEMKTSTRLIRYYVNTFPYELKINKEYRNIVDIVNNHPDLSKGYFEKKIRDSGSEIEWNVWINEIRFLCKVGPILIDPDIDKRKSEMILEGNYKFLMWNLLDLQDDENINFLIKNINGKD